MRMPILFAMIDYQRPLPPLVLPVVFALLLSACNLKRVDNIDDDIAQMRKEDIGSDLPLKRKPEGVLADNIILQTAYNMTERERVIVRGSCWDYVNEIFNRAGYPPARRKTVFKSTPQGPFAFEQIRAGDWLYFTNYNYQNNPHSSLFIKWHDKSKKLGLMLSYAGESRNVPASFKVYDLRSVYRIIRGDDL